MLYGMTYCGANLQQSPPLNRTGNDPVARQTRLQYFDLQLEQPNMSITPNQKVYRTAP